MRNNQKVNLFIIGVNKAGSSWLYYFLKAHPQIFMSEVKELYYFNKTYLRDLDKYHSHFDFSQPYQYFGEATPTYYRDRQTAENIKNYAPEAKILAIVRDPIQRLRSQFYFHKQLNIIPEKTTMEEAIERLDPHLIQDSHYEQTLPVYKDIFGEQFKIVSLEKALNNIAFAWQELQNFLCLDQVELPEFADHSENATGSRLFRIIYKSTIRPIKKISPELYKILLQLKAMRSAKKLLLNRLGKAHKSNISEELHQKLRKEFQDTYQYLRTLDFSEIYYY